MKNSFPNLTDIMLQLSEKRQIFHSEADFQHTLAWEIHNRLPNSKMSLERPYRVANRTLHLDMLVENEGISLAIELKYKTKKLQHSCPNHFYHLLNQSAQDIGRYDYIKDIWRLEEITKAIPKSLGWAILLTNDRSYWSVSKNNNTVDAAFRLSDNTILEGTRSWGKKASKGTKKNRELSLTLNKSYPLKWLDYSTFSTTRNSKFRYLAVEIENSG